VKATAMAADLVGYDPIKAGGVFTFGGTGCLCYGLKVGLEKAVPEAIRRGIHEPVVVFASEQSHYAVLNAAGWLGMGQESVVKVPTHLDNSIRLDGAPRRRAGCDQARSKDRLLCRHDGSTDAFGLDDLKGMHALRDELVAEFKLSYVPHIHADAVIGWAWSVFNDYDFLANPLGISRPHDPRPGCGPSSPEAFEAGRLARHRLPQDRLRPLRVVVIPRSRFGRVRPAGSRSEHDAVSLSIGPLSSGHVHLGDEPCRDRADGRFGHLLMLGREGYRTLLGHGRRNGRSAPRGDRIASRHDGAQRRQRRTGDPVSRLPAGRRYVYHQRPRTERPVVSAAVGRV